MGKVRRALKKPPSLLFGGFFGVGGFVGFACESREEGSERGREGEKEGGGRKRGWWVVLSVGFV